LSKLYYFPNCTFCRLISVDIYNICILSENITYIFVRGWETWKEKTFYLYYNYKVNLASQIFITFVVSLLGLLGHIVFPLTKLYIENITYIFVRGWETWKEKTFANLSVLFRRGCKYNLFLPAMYVYWKDKSPKQ
jgi:hypothetical protein